MSALLSRQDLAQDLAQELAAIEAEAIGWQPLEERAYLHVGKPGREDPVITVVGIPDASMAGMNVLLLL